MSAQTKADVGANEPGLMAKISKAGSSTVLMIANHKKSCLVVVGLLALTIVLVFISAHMWPDGFTAQILPAAPWASADYKLRKKNNTDKTRRSDNKVDDWSKDDFIKSVTKFNNIAANVD